MFDIVLSVKNRLLKFQESVFLSRVRKNCIHIKKYNRKNFNSQYVGSFILIMIK